MKVYFEKVEFKNILSYGNNLQSFKFDEGLNAITGRNGHGKSSVLDILSFVLFGQPYRKIKIAELINRVNKKNMYVKAYFKLDNNSYTIERGLKPAKFEITCNGEDFELLSSKKLIQNEIDDILGVNFVLFKQVIALAVNANKPFLTLGAYEKRNIIETIFNIDVFGDMTKQVKNSITQLKLDQKIKINELRSVKATYDSYLKQKEDIELSIKNFKKNKKKDIDTVKAMIQQHKDEITILKSNLKLGKAHLKTLKPQSTTKPRTQKQELSDELSILKYEIDKCIKDNEFLNSNDTCIYCGTDITEDHKDKHVSDNTNVIVKNSRKISKLEKSILDLNTFIEDNRKAEKTKRQTEDAITSVLEKIKIHTDEIDKKKLTIVDIKERELSFDIEKFNKELDTHEFNFNHTFTDAEDIDNELDTQTILSNILSDNGVKSHFMAKLLPLLNSKINGYLEDFDMPFVFEFDDTLSEQIISLVGKKENVSYFSCSEGEKKRIDLSILLSFIDTIKNISNWDCNILFFDELLDSAVDPTNLQLILNAIKEMTTRNKQSSYVVSHRVYDGGLFNNVVKIEKNGSFSTIKYEDS
tara:strand:+ start:7199 stop:8950 length:1752 start_codon:yes stop_codon:yes gene_type:complete